MRKSLKESPTSTGEIMNAKQTSSVSFKQTQEQQSKHVCMLHPHTLLTCPH